MSCVVERIGKIPSDGLSRRCEVGVECEGEENLKNDLMTAEESERKG